jgi:hypothetical protein
MTPLTHAPPAPDPELDALVAACWPRAQAHWSRFLLLRDPADDGDQSGIARIHLGTRQVGLNYRLIREKGLLGCVEALLAHEVGHHVRYPGSLTVQARLHMLEKALLPLEGYSLINLFTDLLINDALRPALEEQLVRVYQAFQGERSVVDERVEAEPDPAFLFYLAVYEERWRREPGSLMGPGHDAFGREFPAYRAEAHVLGQDLFHLGPNLYTQFLYFVSVVSRYVRVREEKGPALADGPYDCGSGEPSADDWAEALTPDAREREAVERARREGWVRKEAAERLTDRDALARRIFSLPGAGGDDATRVPEVMAAYYRREAERYLLRPPPRLVFGEATTPTTLEEWEPGDPLRDVDWPATLAQRGPLLGAAQPLRRQRVAEAEGWEVPLWQPRVEVYLDVSGSMPDPRVTRNAMTLAAQVLVTGAIRAGGWARAVLYSGAAVPFLEWCRSEAELSRFLMHYVGGGTEFPFDLLRSSVSECRDLQPIRVVISDGDFHANYAAAPDRADVFAEAVAASPHFVLMLHATGDVDGRYGRAGAKVVTVAELEDYPAMAAALAAALFEGERHVAP